MKVANWRDRDDVRARLANAGMGTEAAALAANHFLKSAAAISSSGFALDTDVVAAWVPGRIEVFGKHTDYCGGESILAAAERGICVLAVRVADDQIRIIDARRDESVLFAIGPDLIPQRGHWSNYPQTAARRLARNFPHARCGATIAFSSNLPPAAGMSSSSALVVGMFLILAEINQLATDETYSRIMRTPEDIAGYVSTIENGMSFGSLTGDKGVGTFGGSEDHIAILCGQPDVLVQYSFSPAQFRRRITLDKSYTFAIASSGVIAEKTGAALDRYNRVAALARSILDAWRLETKQTDASLAAILNSAREAEFRLRAAIMRAESSFTATELLARLDHFVRESQLIKSVPSAVVPETIDQFSAAAQQSHQAAATLLDNQTPETLDLAAIADQLGACGASAFGAGFGGSVWALVERQSADGFLSEWQARYAATFPKPASRAEFFLSRPGTRAATWGV